ncbi:hypothetical protein N7481_001452 [Penicillium waksmanii]|uniref:uncharacterized protein n=1 Tax=Penicillium waksmanii TaxID=69791 RepID=UPI00254919C6|nr:uncharacterized protein N7481_001452 [Penicillium waksmanii]KAJ6001043.1 hypothetical protein N7481_001452 [Penicillium waksmanii]
MTPDRYVPSTALAYDLRSRRYPFLEYPRRNQARTRFYHLFYQIEEQGSLLENQQQNLISELERLRNYPWALYNEYNKAMGELERAKMHQ